MPIYKLEPIAGTEGHKDWWASSLAPTPVWLRAGNSNHARQRIHQATYVTTCIPGDRLCAHWVNAALLKCTEDASHGVPANVAMIANGRITLKLP